MRLQMNFLSVNTVPTIDLTRTTLPVSRIKTSTLVASPHKSIIEFTYSHLRNSSAQRPSTCDTSYRA